MNSGAMAPVLCSVTTSTPVPACHSVQNCSVISGTTTSSGGRKAKYASTAPETQSHALRRRMKSEIDLKLCSGKSSSMSGAFSLLSSCEGAGVEVLALKHEGKRTCAKAQQAAVACANVLSRSWWAGHGPLGFPSFRTSGRGKEESLASCVRQSPPRRRGATDSSSSGALTRRGNGVDTARNRARLRPEFHSRMNVAGTRPAELVRLPASP